MSVNISFDFDGVEAAIEALERMNPTDTKIRVVMEELCKVGAETIRQKYSGTTGSGENEASVDWYESDYGEYVITAQSSHLFYLEFGAGIAKNSSEPYPIARPPGIGAIGSQGAGYGDSGGWYYPDPESKTGYSYTTGTKARCAFPAAYDAMVAALPGIISEVFKS